MRAGAELENEFWEYWRDVDYSWDGLAQQPLHGWVVSDDGSLTRNTELSGPPATLQDYWRDQEQKLVSGDGKLWTAVHCPLRWLDGSPAKEAWTEAQWRDLDAIIRERIARYRPPSNRRPSKDRREEPEVPLQGSVIRLAPALPPSKLVPLSVSLEGAWLNNVEVDGRRFEASSFGSAFINGDARFTGVTFVDGSNFSGTTFSKDAYFSDAKFQSSTSFVDGVIGGRASFMRASFDEEPLFLRMSFTGNASFGSANFPQGATFREVSFEREANFSETTFADDAMFSDCEFEGRILAQAARFSAFALFWDVRFPDSAADFTDAFNRARFESVADFTGSGTHWIAALNHAVAAGKLVIDRNADIISDADFRDVIADLPDAAAKQADRTRTRYELAKITATAEQIQEWKQESLESMLRAIEGGCRTIKTALGKDRDELLEQRYYRFQLVARQLQRDTPAWERLMLALYGQVSNYGTSIALPARWLGAMLALVTLLLWTISKALMKAPVAPIEAYVRGEMKIDPDFWEALRYSASRVFPFGGFHGSAPEEGSWLYLLLHDYGPGWALLVRAIGALESLVAIVLVFLFALAIRRRFQIS